MKTNYNTLRTVRFTVDNGADLCDEAYRSLSFEATNEDNDRVTLALTEGAQDFQLEASLPASMVRQLAQSLLAFADLMDAM